MKVTLNIESDRFIELRPGGPLHVATPLGPDYWLTCCGRQRQRTNVSELTTREADTNDPDTDVCRWCIRRLRSVGALA